MVALEERVRRDLLVSDDDLVAFFDARVPDDVTSARRFGTWWAKAPARRARPAHLRAGRPHRPGRRRPSTWPASPRRGRSGDARLPLTYVLDPTSDLDGVVVDVPLPLLDAVGRRRARLAGPRPPARPGHRARPHPAQGRCAAATRRRRRGRRRRCSPRIGPEDGPLLDVLAAALTERGGPPVAAPPPRPGRGAGPPPRHLPRRRRRAAGRSPGARTSPALRRRLAERVREALAAAVAGRRGARRDRLGVRHDPDHRRRSTHAGHAVTGHPALVDEGDAVGLRVLPSEPEARAAMWGGTRRLLLLQLGSPLRTLDRALPNADEARPRPRPTALSAAEAYRDVRGRRGRPAARGARRPGARRRRRSRRSLAAVRAGFARTAAVPRRAWWPRPSATPPRSTRRSPPCSPPPTTRRCSTPAPTSTACSAGDGSPTPASTSCPTWSATSAPSSTGCRRPAPSPTATGATSPASRQLEREYRRVAARDATGEVRTMLEELRVSTFAQSVGAKGGVSEPKVREPSPPGLTPNVCATSSHATIARTDVVSGVGRRW